MIECHDDDIDSVSSVTMHSLDHIPSLSYNPTDQDTAQSKKGWTCYCVIFQQ